MSDRDEPGDVDGDGAFDPGEVEAAVRFDLEVDAALAAARRGAASEAEPVVDHLLEGLRRPLPPALRQRVSAIVTAPARRAWRRAQAAAAALAAVLAYHGGGNLVSGRWVAEHLDEAYSPHAATEAGLALLALSVALAVAATRRRWLPVAVAAGAPMGLALGVQGAFELETFPAGGILHLTEGVLAAALLVLWLLARRYVTAPRHEEMA